MRPEDEVIGFASEGVKRARALGADHVEVYVRESRSTSLHAQGPTFAPHETFSEGVGVRIVVGGRLGASAGDSLAALDDALRRALAAARGAGGKTMAWSFPAPAGRATPLAVHPTIVAGDEEHVAAVAEALHGRALAAPGVTYAGTAVRLHHQRFAVANSEGLEVAAATGHLRAEIEVRVSRAGKDRTARDSWTAAGPLGPPAALDALVDAAVADARSALDDAPLSSAVAEAVLAPPAAAQVVEIFLASLSGQAAVTRQSPLSGRLGETVVSELFTLHDRPHAAEGRGRRAVDDEGTPTVDRTMVERGVLRAFAHDATSAHAAGVAPTGQARRASLAAVHPRVLNAIVEPGNGDLRAVVEGAERAVLVTQPLLGAFVANHVTGDFSVVAPFAHLVERGRVRHALPATTVAGNVHRVLASLRAVGADSRAFLPAKVPTLRAGGLSCAN